MLRSKLKTAELDMTPMIDVVFLLIVFFTLVINFTAADYEERIKLPISELAQPPEEPQDELITLHILTDGKVIYAGVEYALSDLRTEIEHRIRELGYTNVSPDMVTVIIRADKECTSGQVLDVVELCQKLNLERFSLRTKQREK
jgi:biopolymer transport protein ExbD